MENITPSYTSIPMKDKIIVPPSFNDDMGQSVGNLKTSPNETSVGEGDSIFKVTASGIHLGNTDFASAPFSVSMAGSAIASDLTLTGGTIKYGKTSFTDSTNAGYWISSAGFYFGSASDANFVKYIISNGSFTMKGAVTANTGSVINGTYITDATITGAKIGSATITASNITNATITATQIANATITGTQVASGTITSDNITNATITGTDIAAATVTGSNIGATTITAGNIVNATITGTQIAATTIQAGNIANATITTSQISGSAGITGGQIANATITTSQISNTAGIIGGQIDNLTITAGNIANLTITSSQIANATITGTQIASDTIAGSKLKIGNQSWSHDLAFSSTDLNTVAWASGTITMADTATYSITGANTGDMAARTYIYLDIAVSTTVLQTTTTAGTAVGDGKILIAVAENATTEASFQVYGGIGGLAITGGDIENSSILAAQIASGTITANEIGANVITASEISAGTITTTEIAADTITAENIAAATITGTEIAATTIAAGNIVANTITSSELTTGAFVTATANITDAIITNAKINDLEVSKLTAGTITSQAITLAVAAGTGDTYFAGKSSGATFDWANWEVDGGVMLGIDDSDSDKAKLFVGNDTTNRYIKFDGTDLIVAGDVIPLTFFEAGQNLSANNWVFVATDGKIYKTDAATSKQTGRTIGVCTSTTASGSQAPIQMSDSTSAVSGLTVTSAYYIQNPTASITASATINNSLQINDAKWGAQTFTVGGSAIVCSGVQITLTKNDSPGALKVALQATSSNEPDGSDIASCSIPAADIGAGDTTINVAFNYPVELTASTLYAIVLTATSSSGTNYYLSRGNNTNHYASGTAWNSNDSGVNWTDRSVDEVFKIYTSNGTIGTSAGTISKQSGIALSASKLLIQ